MSNPKIVIYDAVDRSAISRVWGPGAALYRAMGKCSHVVAATSVAHGLDSIEEIARVTGKPIAQIEWWCHASPGRFLIGKSFLRTKGLSVWRNAVSLTDIGQSMTPDGVFWIRGCSAFAGPDGQTFARLLSQRLSRTVAAHTHVIGTYGMHSGLHTLKPGEEPEWHVNEGMKYGRHGRQISTPRAPRTITALHNAIPPGW